MRTTLSLVEHCGKWLTELAHESGRSFRDVVDEIVRRGLGSGEPRDETMEAFRVVPKGCGFKLVTDPFTPIEVSDDLEIDRLGTGGGFWVHDP